MNIDWTLLRRSINSNLNKEEQQVLNEWLEASSEHRELYRNIKSFFADSESFRLENDRKCQFKMGYERRLLDMGRKVRMRYIIKVTKIAALFIIPLGIALSLWFTIHPIENLSVAELEKNVILPGSQKAILITNDGKSVNLSAEIPDVEVASGVKAKNGANALVYSDTQKKDVDYGDNQLIIPRGGEFSIQLSDGSTVWLNSASELKYPVSFSGQERRVYLKGEAYFQVASDKQRAFIVVTDDIAVKVYGTEFNINTRIGDCVQTTLVKGAVSMCSKNSGEQMLKPNQMAQYNRVTRETEIKEVDAANYISWKSGVYIFENQSIEQIMKELSLWYDVEVFFRNNIAKNQRFSGSLPRYRDIDEMLSLIGKTSHVQFEVKEKMVIVK